MSAKESKWQETSQKWIKLKKNIYIYKLPQIVRFLQSFQKPNTKIVWLEGRRRRQLTPKQQQNTAKSVTTTTMTRITTTTTTTTTRLLN